MANELANAWPVAGLITRRTVIWPLAAVVLTLASHGQIPRTSVESEDPEGYGNA